MSELRASLIAIADIAKDAQRLITDGRYEAAIVALGSIVEKVNKMTEPETTTNEDAPETGEGAPGVEETQEAEATEETTEAEATEEAAPADDFSYLEDKDGAA